VVQDDTQKLVSIITRLAMHEHAYRMRKAQLPITNQTENMNLTKEPYRRDILKMDTTS